MFEMLLNTAKLFIYMLIIIFLTNSLAKMFRPMDTIIKLINSIKNIIAR